MKRFTLAYAGIAAVALALPMVAQAEPGKRGGKGMHLAMMDTDADGNITREAAEAAIAGKFARIDANADGFVSQEEMKAHHEARRAEWQAKRAERADRPERADGKRRQMDPAKVEQRKAKRAEKAAERWAAMDADGDGRLSLAEFTAAHIKYFDRLDADGDGVVTKAEIDAAKGKMKERRGEWRGKKAPE